MADIDLIKETYARMTEIELLLLASCAGPYITNEAFPILKDEFQKRNLSFSIIVEIENKRANLTTEKIADTNENSESIPQSLLSFICEQKYDAKTNKEIILKGISQEDTSKAIEILRPVLKKESLKMKMLLLIVLLTGLGLIFISYLVLNYLDDESEDYIEHFLPIVGSIIVGMIWVFSRLLPKDMRLDRILKNIDEEKTPLNDSHN